MYRRSASTKNITEEEVTSPTFATESVFITTTIDNFENRDVATVDLPGAFLHTDIDPKDDTINMVLQGEFTKLTEMRV